MLLQSFYWREPKALPWRHPPCAAAAAGSPHRTSIHHWSFHEHHLPRWWPRPQLHPALRRLVPPVATVRIASSPPRRRGCVRPSCGHIDIAMRLSGAVGSACRHSNISLRWSEPPDVLRRGCRLRPVMDCLAFWFFHSRPQALAHLPGTVVHAGAPRRHLRRITALIS